LIKNYRNSEIQECTFVPNKGKRNKSKILNKTKQETQYDLEEETPIHEKLYKVINSNILIYF